MKKKILFRADGNQFIGLGHLYRLFAVIEMLKGNYEFVLATKSSSTTVIVPNDYELFLIPDEIDIPSEPNWLGHNFKASEYIVVADGYQFDSRYQEQIKRNKYQLVYIDDLAQEHMFADIVINHAPLLDISSYTAEEYTRYGLGTKYALLRPAFLESARRERAVSNTDTAFVCFGGADMLNLSAKVTKGLLATSFTNTIHIVLGEAYKHNEIFDLVRHPGKKVHIHRNLSEVELINVMSSCNFAIVPTSTIFYELCCVKMPILAGYFVENQKLIYEAMAKEEVILEGGDFAQYSVSDFEKVFRHKLGAIDPKAYTAKQHVIFDGNSGKRVLGLINGLNVSFRVAEESDLQRTFEWSSDAEVRKNSFHSETITIESHTTWFLNKIVQSSTLFLIVLVNGCPAGVVRYENSAEATVVGILISAKFRGQNLASPILRKSADICFEKFESPILAYIKKENIASSRSFEKAGYAFIEEKEIQGHESGVYKLEQEK
ncbi:UDP-2,4-diacetamido-2,4,6-trideoxy-beta-L-altropyranose hydrolase [Maribacter sp. 2307UL18-2]|uniref:UDP-2,4-diacetamido-2,4, 6-trideoxy-beta-L-altropyranose hydrolase n=1 Tax=Maribacter sp. 2307UL18-2 TaxID=3386274 RepID=UPI0039BC665A